VKSFQRTREAKKTAVVTASEPQRIIPCREEGTRLSTTAPAAGPKITSDSQGIPVLASALGYSSPEIDDAVDDVEVKSQAEPRRGQYGGDNECMIDLVYVELVVRKLVERRQAARRLLRIDPALVIDNPGHSDTSQGHDEGEDQDDVHSPVTFAVTAAVSGNGQSPPEEVGDTVAPSGADAEDRQNDQRAQHRPGRLVHTMAAVAAVSAFVGVGRGPVILRESVRFFLAEEDGEHGAENVEGRPPCSQHPRREEPGVT
jgi:hypothetical protein